MEREKVSANKDRRLTEPDTRTKTETERLKIKRDIRRQIDR